MWPLLLSVLSAVSFFVPSVVTTSISPGFPNGKIYGVNLGSWLVLEAWMLPQEWLDMGGQMCDDCSTCIASEWAFGRAFPDTVDEIFNKHWESWFSQTDVDTMARLGLNTVRIPLGFWIVEPIVDRSTEFYPRGGIKQLKRGLSQLKAAGISAILDHHALPGVQTAGQMFTGNCTSDVEFYTEANYHRALVWTAVMTGLSHLDPDFGSVFAIEAVNEPIMDATQTPGYGDFQVNFVKVVRAVELALGITVPNEGSALSSRASNNATASLLQTSKELTSSSDTEVAQALADAAPVLAEVLSELGLASLLFNGPPLRTPLVTTFMDINWQFNSPPNPAAAAIGPQGYDNHLYYSFGGVADPNPDAYLTSICNLNRVQADAALGNSPLWFGEWGLPTQFNATDDFLYQWADAQKLAYSQSAGWIFWNFKVEMSDLAGDLSRQWSYFDAVNRGFFSPIPAEIHNPSVCAPFIATASSS
ncbi:glycoside hydrolase family 5 protein [Schizopora paradoxa]|uniref:Glycoside hydrolase family 5 protein n=1 Tax=Schizopora paradoxa TaxID=27342 RepID=A0A0H2R5N7_9AGAM|nr:glycoside hydrolase family 5 protein [Schizopora paradoxa]